MKGKSDLLRQLKSVLNKILIKLKKNKNKQVLLHVYTGDSNTFGSSFHHRQRPHDLLH